MRRPCVDAVLKAFGARIQSIDHLDGVTVDLGDGSWFNLRTSNTEPLLRLNVEARTAEEVDEIVDADRRAQLRGRERIRRERQPRSRCRRPRRRRGPARRRSRRSAAGGVDGRRAGARHRGGARRRRARAVRSDHPPRTVVWVAGRGTAETAGAMLAAALGGRSAAPIVVAAEAPPWIGALDVLVVAGDDPGDPALVAAAATGVRRGARVVVVAPRTRVRCASRGGPGGGAGAAAAGARRLRPGPIPGRRAGRPARGRPGHCGSTWPRWPTNWTPRRCATARAVNCSPIPRRRWPNGCRAATSCSPATTRRRWRWPGTRAP